MSKMNIPDFCSVVVLRGICLFLGLFFCDLYAPSLFAQCQKTGPYPVEPFDVFEFTVSIDSIARDDLADPLQGLCAVSIEYEHQSVADMLIELESPAGQVVTLVGPIANGDLTFFTQWNISFLPCAATPDPDLNFGDQYSNLYSWGVLGEANGSYHPFSGCLEDFDTGPVTGDWTVKVRDQGLFYEGEIQSITLFFCDPSGLECLDCAVPQNQFQGDSAVICSNMPSATPTIDTASNFDSSFHQMTFLTQDEDSIISYSNSINFDSIAFGTYDLCIWTLEKADSAAFFNLIDTIQHPDSLESAVEQLDICAVNGGCTFVNWVDNSDTLFIDTATCVGEAIIFMDDTLTQAGSYIFLDSSDLCPQTIRLEYAIQDPQANLSDLDTINCARGSVIVDASSSLTSDSTIFRWENSDGLLLGTAEQIPIFEGGEFALIVSDGLCFDSLEFSVEDQRAAPFFTISGDSTITCSRDSAVVFVDSVESGAQHYWVFNNDTLHRDTVILSQLDTIELYVTGASHCPDSQTVFIQADFRQPEFQIDTNIVLCPGDVAPLRPIFDTMAIYDYEWYGPDSFQSSRRDTFTNIPGLYVLQATHPETGCQASDSLILMESAPPDLPRVTSDTLGCLQRSVKLNLDTIRQDWAYFWLSPQGDTLFVPEPEVNLPGEYTLWVVDPSACSDSLSFLVSESLNFPRYNILPDTLTCIDEDATLEVEFLTDPDGFEVTWEGPLGRTFDSLAVVTALPGPYIFRLNNGGVCETADTVNLVEDFTPFEHILAADTISCSQENARLTITGGRENFDFQWEGPDGFSDRGDTILVSNPGPYVVAIESVNCFYERGIQVQADTSKPTFQFDHFPINCARDTGRIRFSNADLSQVGIFDPDSMDFIPLSNFSYEYTEVGSKRFQLIGNNGCAADSTIELTSDTIIPPIRISLDSFTCDQTQIKASWQSQANAISSRWTQDGNLVSSGDSLITSQSTPIQLELQFENACRYDTILQPILDTLPTEVNINPQNLNCDRTSYDLTPAITGEWRNFQWQFPTGDTLDNVFPVRIEMAGEYSWSITGTNGCQRSDRFSIIQDTLLPKFQIQNTLIPCHQAFVNVIPEGDSAALSSYSWHAEDGQTFDVWSPPLAEGTYTFIFEGQNACQDSVKFEVDADQVHARVLNLDSNYVLNCANPTQSISPQIDGPIDTSFWIRPSGDRTNGTNITFAEPGPYQFFIRERNVCWDTFSIEVALDTIQPELVLREDTLTCNRAELTLQAQIQAQNPSFEWSGPGSFSSQEAAPTIDRPGVYYLTLRDENGCFTEDSVRISADLDVPQVNLPDTFFQNCNRPIVQVSIDIESDQEVMWSRSGEIISNQTQFETEPEAWLLAAVTGANGCVGTDSVFLSDRPRFPRTDWQLPVLACDNLEDTIQLLTSNGDYAYSWSGPGNFVFNGPEAVIREPGIYTVQYQNEAQCQTIDSLQVEASSQPPEFTLFSEDTLRCLDSMARYEIRPENDTASLLFQWESISGQILSSPTMPEARLQGPGQFVVTVQDIDSFCVSTDTLDLQFAGENEWVLSHTVLDQYCIEDSFNGIFILVPGNPDFRPFTYVLQEDTIPVGDLQSLQPGDYEITVYDGQGCSGDINFTVVDRSEEQSLYIGEDREVSLGREISIEPEFSVSYLQRDSLTWVVNTQDSCFGCNPFEWVIRGPTQIEAQLTTVGGCILTDVVNLSPPLEDLIFVPNVFSPNDDGVNDFFFVQTAFEELTTIDQIQIFNRSGNLVFENRNFPPNIRREGWDGMFRGQKQDPQVFAVLLKYTVEGKQRTEVYSLTLIH